MFSDLDRSHRSVIAIISTLLFLAFSIIIIICLESSVCSGPEERDQCTMENTLRTIELQSNLGKYLPQSQRWHLDYKVSRHNATSLTFWALMPGLWQIVQQLRPIQTKIWTFNLLWHISAVGGSLSDFWSSFLLCFGTNFKLTQFSNKDLISHKKVWLQIISICV